MAHIATRYLDLVSGKPSGAGSSLARTSLSLLSGPYRAAIAARNWYFDWLPSARRHVDRPVISVGNITVGGTGKTPLTAKLTDLLIARGKKVAILTRGYKGSTIRFDDDDRQSAAAEFESTSDETRVLRQKCPQAAIYVNSDRVAAAVAAIEDGSNCILLDDGFQHRRLARDLDIVLVDATCPFGHGRMLPRGLLREPLSSLSRAQLIVLTRSDEIADSAKTDIIRAIQRASNSRPLIEAVQRINGFLEVKGRPVAGVDPSSMQAVIFAGIGNFESFRRCIQRMGVKILAAYEFPDHHYYSAEEISGLADTAAAVEANVLLTTQKDTVKLIGRWSDSSCPLWALNLEVEFFGEGDRILTEMVEEAIS